MPRIVFASCLCLHRSRVLSVLLLSLAMALTGGACAAKDDPTTTVSGGSTGESIVVITTDPRPTSTTDPRPPETAVPIATARKIINSLAAVMPSGDVPQHFTAENGEFVRAEGDFDANTYFGTLSHLSPEEGWVLDYLYQMQGIGGRPFVYARPSERPPYASFDEYVAATPGEPQNASGERRFAREYLGHIQIDDSPEGYFQFVALLITANQFYLFGHAGYNDATIVYDKAFLEEVISTAGSSFGGAGLPAEVREKAAQIDPTPTVDLSDESTAVVRLVTFSQWGGFTETKYTISRRFPHTFVAEETRTLVEYDCGVQF
jgi:hypothetical protein